MINKKAALNLSIQAIVIVVIAFVVLGLGLGFVRSQFSSIESTSTAVQEQISQQILDDLRTGNKKLSFPATKLTLETGEESVQAIGVKNTEDGDRTLRIGFQVKTDEGFTVFTSEVEESFTTVSGVDTSGKIIWDNSDILFDAGESRVIPVTITAPDKSGNYLYKVIIYKIVDGAEEPFDERTFFIKTS
jgi:type II secretory pathway pseudopilin PulG